MKNMLVTRQVFDPESGTYAPDTKYDNVASTLGVDVIKGNSVGTLQLTEVAESWVDGNKCHLPEGATIYLVPGIGFNPEYYPTPSGPGRIVSVDSLGNITDTHYDGTR